MCLSTCYSQPQKNTICCGLYSEEIIFHKLFLVGLVHNNTLIMKTSVGYLDSINEPATETSTIYEVMNRALSIVDSLHLTSIVCVFDQAIYSKAVEIKWKEPEKFRSCVLMMGMFHTTMMHMGILSNRFKDAGLRDLLIQSSVIAEGSIDRALCGKTYKRGVRM